MVAREGLAFFPTLKMHIYLMDTIVPSKEKGLLFYKLIIEMEPLKIKFYRQQQLHWNVNILCGLFIELFQTSLPYKFQFHFHFTQYN